MSPLQKNPRSSPPSRHPVLPQINRAGSSAHHAPLPSRPASRSRKIGYTAESVCNRAGEFGCRPCTKQVFLLQNLPASAHLRILQRPSANRDHRRVALFHRQALLHTHPCNPVAAAPFPPAPRPALGASAHGSDRQLAFSCHHASFHARYLAESSTKPGNAFVCLEKARSRLHINRSRNS